MKDRRRPPARPAALHQTGAARQAGVRQVRALLERRRVDEARAAATEHLRRHPRDAECLRLRAVIADVSGDLAGAAAWAAKAEEVEPHVESRWIEGDVARRRGRTDEAVERCRAALALSPEHLGVSLTLAQTLEAAVRVEELRPVLAHLESRLADAPPRLARQVHVTHAAMLVHEGRFAESIARLDAHVLVAGTPEPERIAALHLRAKACDRAGRHDDAFESAATANRLAGAAFDPLEYARQIHAIETHWTRRSMAAFPSSGSESELPVFIAGMPRSGTSLLDQVIDAHRDAAGVGEMDLLESFARRLEQVWRADLPAPRSFGPLRHEAFRACATGYESACRAEAPDARRIVNKALGNNRIVGLLARLFPRTRIIHAIRDPRDVAISCFMGGFNNDAYPWTTRLDWIAAAWAQSRRLMDHWRRETDLPILEVRYEDLVVDPATQFPRVISFLGLDWDDGCTRFHESRRTVRTLSYDQVNRPLYTSSIARWQRYERHLRGITWVGLEPGS